MILLPSRSFRALRASLINLDTSETDAQFHMPTKSTITKTQRCAISSKRFSTTIGYFKITPKSTLTMAETMHPIQTCDYEITQISIAPYGRHFRGAGHACKRLARVATRQCGGRSRTRDLLTASPTRYHYTTRLHEPHSDT